MDNAVHDQNNDSKDIKILLERLIQINTVHSDSKDDQLKREIEIISEKIDSIKKDDEKTNKWLTVLSETSAQLNTDMRLLTHTITTIIDRQDKSEQDIKANNELEKRVIKVESAINVLKPIGLAIISGLAGIAVLVLYGGGG